MPDLVNLMRQFGEIALIWLPLLMFGLIIYLLFRTLQVMPRVKPKHVHATSKSSVTWAEVSVPLPDSVPDVPPVCVSVTMMSAFAPTAAGPWMWALVALEVSPL